MGVGLSAASFQVYGLVALGLSKGFERGCRGRGGLGFRVCLGLRGAIVVRIPLQRACRRC